MFIVVKSSFRRGAGSPDFTRPESHNWRLPESLVFDEFLQHSLFTRVLTARLNFQIPRSMPESRLTRYELELMDVLWRLGEGTVQDVCENLGRDLAYTSVMTTLSLLESKKQVLERVKQGRAYLYRPLVTREEMSRSILSDLKDVLFKDKLPELMLNFMEEEQPSSDDLRELKEAIRKLESQEKDSL